MRSSGWFSDRTYAILGSHGLVKIGHSRNPAQRIRNLQTGSPFRLSLAFTIETHGYGEAVEREAHAILDKHRQDGEWFAVPVEVAVAAISAAAYRVAEAIEGRARAPRWWLRYAVLTAAVAPVWTFGTPAPFVAVTATLIAWSSFRLIRWRGAIEIKPALRWAGVTIAALASSVLLAMPFAGAKADDQKWIRKGATICNSAQDLEHAKAGEAAHCIAAPMAFPVQVQESFPSAVRLKILGMGATDDEAWSDPNSLEDQPSAGDQMPD